MVMSSNSAVPLTAETRQQLEALTDLELAQLLAERLAIKPLDWHRLNRDRRVRAREQLAAALVFLIKNQPEEALPRVQQAMGWLDHSLTAPPCPSHGERQNRSEAND